MKSNVDFLVDAMIVQTILNNSLTKNAGFSETIDELVGKLKSLTETTTSKDKESGKSASESIINMIAPGVLATALSSFGMPWIGGLVGLATVVFDIDVAAILSSIYNNIKEMISGDKKTSPAAVDAVVQSAVEAHTKPATQEEADAAPSRLATLPKQSAFRDARIVKLAMIAFSNYDFNATKELKSNASIISTVLSIFGGQKAKTASVLAKILGLIFKVILTSAGLMIAGSALKSVISPKEEKLPAHVSVQKKFPLQKSYTETTKPNQWVMNIPNNEASISDMLVSLAKKVYQGLDNLDAVIKNTASFSVILNTIRNYNRTSEGDNLVFIPKNFTSEKNIVDWFIDEVAADAK